MWHAKSRSGTNFADPKTRIVRYKVMTKAPAEDGVKHGEGFPRNGEGSAKGEGMVYGDLLRKGESGGRIQCIRH